ncbi:hypothetical protein PCANC_12884 [Puccinia coronata f. sp. avenae]|uniref:Uncharacterized protein n=1 Tax=Puccinia coronata f. sp. avenae TaxID=200324 RepID=A0A2N5VE52_9BASI|nr:hypothetical protein PCANC_12884 [Puccinia coronata f. sp. avenae]
MYIVFYSAFSCQNLPQGTRSGQPYANPAPPATKLPTTPQSLKHTTSFPPFVAINTPLPDHLEMSAGKSTAPGKGDAARAPQFVSLDQLAALFQALNRLVPKEEKTSDELRTDRAIALAHTLSKYQKLGKAIEPQLAEDGVNWLDWDAAITATITREFEFKGYLVTNKPDPNHDRAALT